MFKVSSLTLISFKSPILTPSGFGTSHRYILSQYWNPAFCCPVTMLTEIAREFKKERDRFEYGMMAKVRTEKKIMGVSKGRLEIKEIERKINVEKGVERKKHWRIDFLLFAGWPVLETKEATSVSRDGRSVSCAIRLIALVESIP